MLYLWLCCVGSCDDHRLMELLGQVNSADNISRDAEEILLDVVNSFIENVTVGAAHLALHRNSTVIAPEDVLLYLGTLLISLYLLLSS